MIYEIQKEKVVVAAGENIVHLGVFKGFLGKGGDMVADQDNDEFRSFGFEPIDDFPVFFDNRSFGLDENEIRLEVKSFFFPGLVGLFFGNAVSPEDLVAGFFG